MVGEASTNDKNVTDVQTNTAAAKTTTTGDVSDATAPAVHKTRGKRGGRGNKKPDTTTSAAADPAVGDDATQKAAKSGKKSTVAATPAATKNNQADDVMDKEKDTRTPSRSTLRRQAKRAARGDNDDATGGANHPIVDQLNKKLDDGAKPTTKTNTTTTPAVAKAPITIPKPRKVVGADGGLIGPKDPTLLSAHYDAIIAQIDIQIAQGQIIAAEQQPSNTNTTASKKQGQGTTTTANDAISTMDTLKAAKNLMIVEKTQALARWERIFAKLNPTTTTTTNDVVTATSTADVPSDTTQQKKATRRVRGGRGAKK